MALPRRRPPVRLRTYIFVFAAIALFLILAHGPLLNLPFYWDESGQFIPAALDIYRAGAWIPVSTLPNVHPPAVMAYLAAVWSIFGYSIQETRIAMLLVAALGALFAFLLAIELARGSPGAPAFAALCFLLLSPLFFAQSMLAQLDMPAMCLSVLALLLFLQHRFEASAIACAILVLVKETGMVEPVLFGCWLLYERRWRAALWFLVPFPGIFAWLLALHHATGHWLGNPAFAAYNVRETLHPAKIVLAIARRTYYLFGGTGHFIGAAALLYALPRMPLLRSREWRIAAAFVAAHLLAVSLAGGAVLERYLLPVLPIVYIAFAIGFQALLPQARRVAVVALGICLIAANFVNPIYPFPFENNLAFASFVHLEQSAAAAVDRRRPGLVATAFPLAEALRNPDLGYVADSHRVIEIAGFGDPEIEKLKTIAPDILIVYSTAWDPLHLIDHRLVRNFLAKYYGYVPQMPSEDIAAALSMRISERWRRNGLWMEMLVRN